MDTVKIKSPDITRVITSRIKGWFRHLVRVGDKEACTMIGGEI
jgi:hypothetical protein